MSKCSIVRCPKYTSEGKILDLGNGVAAWVPLCSRHNAEWASDEENSQAKVSTTSTKTGADNN